MEMINSNKTTRPYDKLMFVPQDVLSCPRRIANYYLKTAL